MKTTITPLGPITIVSESMAGEPVARSARGQRGTRPPGSAGPVGTPADAPLLDATEQPSPDAASPAGGAPMIATR